MSHNIERLEELRSKLQNKLRAQAYIDEQLAPFEEILIYLQKSKVHFDPLGLMGLNQEWAPFLSEILQRSPFRGLKMDYGNSKPDVLPDRLFKLYPSTNSFRYVPSCPKIDVPEGSLTGLSEAISSLDITNQKVHVCYLRYAPLLQLDLYDLKAHANENLFNLWHGDVVIFPDTLSWLIAYTLEEEWYAGSLETDEGHDENKI